jgi:hypothetical protein
VAALVALASLAAGSAQALTVSDLDPVYFPTSSGSSGFTAGAVQTAGLSIAFDTTPANAFPTAGNPSVVTQPDLAITQQLFQIYQNPQARRGHPSPTFDDPFIADSRWTIRNDSGGELPDLLLLFTGVDYSNYGLVPVGLDGDSIDIVRHTANGTEYFYGAIPLGPLAPNQEVTVTVRYIVAGRLKQVGNQLVMPPLLVRGVVVPEPGTALLLTLGLVSLSALRRRS